jgi:PAS domain S-box-containing protein
MKAAQESATGQALAIRQRAEQMALANAVRVPEDLTNLTADEIQRTLHELRVHQIELEMQNEELRLTQEQSDASRARYFDLYDLAPVGYVTLSESGRILEANLTAATLLGVDRGKLARHSFSSFVCKEDHERIDLAYKLLIASGEPQQAQVRLVKKKGAIFWALLEATVSLDPAGRPVSRVMFNDVTKRMRPELILAARSRLLVLAQDSGVTELLRATLDETEALTGSNIGFYHFLEADQTTLTLQAWSTHTERNMCRAEGAGRHYPVDEAGVWADCIRVRRAVIHNHYAALPNRKGMPPGHATVLRELVVPVLRDGRIVAILGVGNKAAEYTEEDARVVTSLADLAWGIVGTKLAQEALRLSEEKFRAITDYTMDWESWFGLDGEYLWVNPAVERITGYTPAEVLALPDFVATLIAPDDRGLFRSHFQGALQGLPGDNFEFRYLHKDGSVQWLSASWQQIRDSSGQSLGVRSSGRNITERKRREDIEAFLARTGSGTPEEPFFNALARYLAHNMGMDIVCIDRLEGDGLTARPVAVWCDGHFEDHLPYALQDTPCGEVVGQVVCCFPAGVCQIFPRDEVLQDLRAESYVGATLWSHDGKPIGLIAVIGRGPLANCALAETTLKLVAERAARELERLDHMQALLDAEWKFRALFEKGPIGVAYHAMIFDASGTPIDYRFLDANASYRELTGVDPRGMNATEAFPGIENDPSDWIGTFGRVARTGEPIRFERYLQFNQRWYDCAAYQYKPDHFVAAFLEITKRKRAEAELTASENRWQRAVACTPIPVMIHDEDGRVLQISAGWTAFSGYGAEDIPTLADWMERAYGKRVFYTQERIDNLFSIDQTVNDGEMFIIAKDGSKRLWDFQTTPLGTVHGGKRVLHSMALDITESKRAEALLQNLLSEKESLLKEIHHRVKNNMQIISSLLRLQSGQSSHPDAKATLLDMQNRVHSMALIHEHLYRSENLAAVDLADYLKGLCQQLSRTFASPPGNIQLHLNLASIRLEIDRAIPCGLLVNELVSNAFKHAFPGGRSGEVRVELHTLTTGTGWHLRVADNGVGLPPEFALGNLTSLGLKLVADLTRQLGARLKIGSGPGAAFEIEFKAGTS